MDPNRVLYAALVIYWCEQLNISSRFRVFIVYQAMKINMLSEWKFDEDFKKTVIKDDEMRAKEFERLEEKARAYCLKTKSESEREAAKAEEKAAIEEIVQFAWEKNCRTMLDAQLAKQEKIRAAAEAYQAAAEARQAEAAAKDAQKAEATAEDVQKAEAAAQKAAEDADFFDDKAEEAAETAEQCEEEAAYARNFWACVERYEESLELTQKVDAALKNAHGDPEKAFEALDEDLAPAKSSRPSKRPR